MGFTLRLPDPWKAGRVFCLTVRLILIVGKSASLPASGWSLARPEVRQVLDRVRLALVPQLFPHLPPYTLSGEH